MALSVAGHDPSNGAGITADLSTFAAHGIFGVSAITALTVQSTVGVAAVEPIAGRFLRQVLRDLDDDLPADGIKIGMLGSAEAASEVAVFLHTTRQASEGKSFIPCVFDPVLMSSSGTSLLGEGGLELVLEVLLPQVSWVTPNWAELAALTGRQVDSMAAAEAAAAVLGERYAGLHVVVTGGELAQPTEILRLPSGQLHRFEGQRVETRATHGTGCAFSSALLSSLILGSGPVEAVIHAKKFVVEAMRSAPNLGKGRGPLNLRGGPPPPPYLSLSGTK